MIGPMTNPAPAARATAAVIDFIDAARFSTFPADAVAIAKRCIIDGLGVMLAGSTQEVSRILGDYVEESGRREATAFGPRPRLVGAAEAALLNGTSGHALDWDDTQLATSADRIFGLLTHPTVPPLAAALAVGERRRVSGRAFLEAFLTGFEVECKIAEAIHQTGAVLETGPPFPDDEKAAPRAREARGHRGARAVK